MRPPCLQANERFNGLKPQKRAVRGKTMSLVLEDSNMALVNTTDTKPSAPGIFVIYDRFRQWWLLKHAPTAAITLMTGSLSEFHLLIRAISAYQRSARKINI